MSYPNEWPTLPDDNGAAYKHGYYEGLREGITKYAWWKDGVQMVGTGGRTLRRALAEIDQQEMEATANGSNSGNNNRAAATADVR